MLRSLQNKETQRKIWITLIVIIGPGFLFWGIGSVVRAPKQKGEVRLSGKNISETRYNDALKFSVLQSKIQFGEAFEQISKFLDFKTLALKRLVILDEARRRHIGVSDQEVIETIQKDPSFSPKGEFDPRTYELLIKYSLRVPARTYEELVRQNLIMQKLIAQVTKDVAVSEEDARKAYIKENEQIGVSYLAAIPENFRQDIDPSEQQLQDYFSAHSVDFKQPLSFNLEYISVAGNSQAEDITSRLAKDESFDQIAKSLDQTPKETGSFGQLDPIPAVGWDQELSKQLYEAEQGKILPLYKGEKEYFLFRIKEKRLPYIPEFKDIQEKVKEAYTKLQSRRLAREKIDSCMQKLSSSPSATQKEFEAAGNACGLKAASTGLFKDKSYVEGIGASDKIFSAARDLDEKAYSPVIELASGFYIVKRTEKVGIDEKKFEEEKEAYRQRMLNQKKDEVFNAFVDGLFAKATGQAREPSGQETPKTK